MRVRLLRKWRRTAVRDRLILLEASCVLVIIRVAMVVWHFQKIRRVLMKLARIANRCVIDGRELHRLIWAVETAKRYLPVRTTCLMEALVAEAMLRQYGYSSILCIGARRLEGQFEAHAWLEDENGVLIGGPEDRVQQYTKFSKLQLSIS